MKLALLLPLSIATMVVAKDGVGPFLHGKTHKQHPKALKQLPSLGATIESPTPTTFAPSSLLVVGGGSPSTNNHPTESPVVITNTPTQSDSVESDSEGSDKLIGDDTSLNEDSTSSKTTATVSSVQSSTTTMPTNTSYTPSTTSSTLATTSGQTALSSVVSISPTIGPTTTTITSSSENILTSNSKEDTQTYAANVDSTLPGSFTSSTPHNTIEQTTTTTTTIFSTQAFEQSNNNSDVLPKLSDDGTICTLKEASNSVQRLVQLSFFYQIETITFDDELLEDVESALIAGMCSSSDNNLRRLMETSQKVIGWNSNPKDTVSTEYGCQPTLGGQQCTVVEGGLTLDLVEDESEEDDYAAIKAYAYEQIEKQFTSLSIDDYVYPYQQNARVVSLKFHGNDTSSLVPLEPPSEGFNNTEMIAQSNDEHISAKYYPSPFVVTLSSALFVALAVGLYHFARGRKGHTSGDDDSATSAVKGLYAIDDDKSHAHETVANTTYNTSLTSLYRGFNPRDADITLPVDSTITFPGHHHHQSKVLNNLSSPNSISRAPIHCPADANEVQYQYAKGFILGEDEETRSEWRRLGILPEVVTQHSCLDDVIREEEESV